MSDLIRRSEAIETITRLDENVVKHSSDMKILAVERIKRLPVAYDKEAVVKQLEEAKEQIAKEDYCRTKHFDENDCEHKDCFKCCAEHLIKIVKVGGIDG